MAFSFINFFFSHTYFSLRLQVSSTSNASLASAIKKRKAPVPPPPALREQTELGEKMIVAVDDDNKRTSAVIINGSHDESDRASSVSDQLSSVSDLSSPQKSPTPEVEPIVERTLTSRVSPGEHAEIRKWNSFFIELSQLLDKDVHRQHDLRVSTF